jgi:acyl-CoA synthetase (NDP forming)/GNAT superfamily N-acetyltransferase
VTTTDAVAPAPATGFSRRTALLADGSAALVREVRASDRTALLALHAAASDASIYLRFFSLNRSAAEAFVERVSSPSAGTWSLVAETRGRLVGIATASVGAQGEAEVALLVDEQTHGLGVGTLLLEHLAAWSLARGVSTFSADVLAENHPMLRVFHDAGFGLREQRDHEVVSVILDIRPSPASVAATDRRERQAERRSLSHLFEPRSVAVLGVSRSRGGIGREVLENVLAAGFEGEVHAFGRAGLDLPGVHCVDSFDDLPRDLDLVVVALPAGQVESAVRSVAARGARTCVVLTSGLGESSAHGQRTEHHLADIAYESGMRIVGPNCFGVLSNLRGTRLDGTFGRGRAAPGALAVGSQSGGVGVALLQAARDRGSGLACFVSMGNKVDVSGNDLLAAWAEDPGVRAAGLYLESFLDPRKFARVASTFGRHKPLLVVFGGTSSAGNRAGASHTAASATPTRALQALFRASGVVAVEGVDDLVDTAALLTEQPLPRGGRLGVLGNAGGLGILAADAAQRAGLVVPELSQATRRSLGRSAPGAASTANPVDLGAAAGADAYREALEVLVAAGEVDAVLVLAAATAVTDLPGVCEAVEWVASAEVDVPVLSVVTGDTVPAGGSATRFGSPEAAVRSLVHAVEYAAWRRESNEPTTTQAWPALAETPARHAGWLAAPEASELVRGIGCRVPAARLVRSVDEALAATGELGYPVVAKAASPEIVHKTDVQLVRTGLRDERDLAAAVGDLLAVLGDGEPLLVQRQVAGPEIAVGLTRDDRFGPLVMLASGGVTLDLWGDQVFLMPPLRRNEIRDALRSLRTWPLLDGFRGSAKVDPEAVLDLVEAVGRLGAERPDLAELDLNPVVCTADGPVCVDVKARLA